MAPTITNHHHPLKTRLQKFLAQAGVASRRTCESLIVAGRVAVNGETITLLGTRVDPLTDEVRLDDEPIRQRRTLRHLALHKPRGCVTTRSDDRDRLTIMDLLPPEWADLYPVGRLDKDSEGLIFLTNDGDFCLRVSHPRHGILKTYQVTTRSRVRPDQLQAMLRGVFDRGERLCAQSARILFTRAHGSVVEMVLTEGRNREIRRLFRSQDLQIHRLKRIRIGSVELGTLPAGRWRQLTRVEVGSLTRPQAAPARRTAK